MNNVTLLHPIYVNYQRRAVFDNSIQGFRKAMAKLRIDLTDKDLGAMFGVETSEEVCNYLEDMVEDVCCVTSDDLEGIDESGIYIQCVEYEEDIAAPYAPGYEHILPGHFVEQLTCEIVRRAF
jgi:hypothetical protein